MMKKQIVYTIAFLFALSVVSAAGASVEAGAQAKANMDTIARLNNGTMAGPGVEAQAGLGLNAGARMGMPLDRGEIMLENGHTLRVEGEENHLRLMSGNVSVNCSESCNLTQVRAQNRVMLQATLSNGRQAEVKVMPETASERALTRLQLNSCEEGNCTIELKEVGKGNSTTLAYEMSAKKKVKILGLFNAKANVDVQVDAETGDVIQVDKPWWVSVKAE